MSSQADLSEIHRLEDLPPRVAALPDVAAVVSALARGESGTIDGTWGSSCALLAVTLAREAPATLLVVLPRIHDVDEFAADLGSYLPESLLVMPAWEGLPGERSLSDPVFGSRLRGLEALESTTPPRAVVTSLPALLQPAPSRGDREASGRDIRLNDELQVDELLQWLVARGFTRVSAIERHGEFSVHGGIVDVYSPGADAPVRIEFFGNDVESLRSFDVETQRRIETLAQVRIAAAAAGGADSETHPAGELWLESLPPGSWVALVEPEELVAEGRHYLDRLDDPRGLYSVEAVLSHCTQRPSVTMAAISAASLETTCHLQVESIERLTGPKTDVFAELVSIVGRNETVLLACHNEGELSRLSELVTQCAPDFAERVRLCIGTVARGFRLVPERLVVVSDHELFGRTEVRREMRRKRNESRAIDSFLDLAPGDLVVHLAHGIGRFRGMELLETNGHKEEHLALEFRNDVRLYVPVSLIHLVQKYVGASKTAPTLSKLGGALWGRQKSKAAAAVTDMASDMLRMQAERRSKPGLACPPDSHLQREFEASFPYVETKDQLQAIEATKEDLERSRPMDRLICGDVGFGKTEVAMRAAFKTVDAGRQVAVLVPTTVLAEQHCRTFSDRMAEYPITIEVLSRFRTRSEQRQILNRLESGGVDIVIGTHRLVQADVRFKDLGLVIIDEEQRFGVEAKEMLKQLRLSVDVLTLSATPIPRTLHMSLLGIRDISNLTTPPQDRTAIETRVCRWDGDLIRHAVVRELNRGGQIYFVHNRVYNIRTIADKLQGIVPEARIGIVHGQMAEHELEENMLAFVAGKLDILAATTIIESGLDIPNANTMFIHQADHYGLADLHQLRGRVGRYKHRAYCYLILEQGRVLTRTAARRLKAIEEFSELGSGFRIAMRDLEIRGAGNILGTEQSGHISAVGYELYCQLLENAVRHLTGEPLRTHPHVHIDLPVEAFLPNAYVPPGRQKIDVYRRLSSLTTLQELSAFADELRDRFGPLPPSAVRLLSLKELQLMAYGWGVTTVRLEAGFAVLEYSDLARIRSLASRLEEGRLRIVDRTCAFLVLPNLPMDGEDLVTHLKSVLR
jgi:transcription-repair coupling factor (superfamily II helicase)